MASVMMIRPCYLIVLAGCWGASGAPAPQPWVRSQPAPSGGVVLAKMKDIDVEGGLSTPRNCKPSALLKRFGDAVVHDCGIVKRDYDPQGNVKSKPLLAARACVAQALSTRRPFVLRWRDGGSDPTCTTWSTGDAACGGFSKKEIRMLVGVLERGEYTTYWIEYDWVHFQAGDGEPRPPGLTGIAVSGSSKLRRCSSLTPVTDDCDDRSLQYCFHCEEATELATCESSREL